MDSSFTFDLDDGNFSFYNYSEYDDSRAETVSKACILYMIICTFGILGNALAIYVILRYQQMRTVTNIYMLSLALGDFVYMLCLLLFALEVAFSSWQLGTFTCRLFWAVLTLVKFLSIYFLTVLCISDFILVYFPDFFNKRLGPKVATMISSSVWVLCLLLGIPIYIFADVDEFASCKIIWPEPISIWSVSFMSYQFVMTFVLPLVVNCICLTLTVVRKRQQEKSSSFIDKGDTTMFSVLCLAFVIFSFPMHVLEMMYATYAMSGLSDEAYYYVSLIPYLKSCVYPILYGFLSTSFKEAYKKVFCCIKANDITNSQERSDGKLDVSTCNC